MPVDAAPFLAASERRDMTLDRGAKVHVGSGARSPGRAQRAHERDAFVGDGSHRLRASVQEALRVDRLVGRRRLAREREKRELERHLHERVGAHSMADDAMLAEIDDVEHDKIGPLEQCVDVVLRARDRVPQRTRLLVAKWFWFDVVAASWLRRFLVLDQELGEPHGGAPVEARVLHAEAGDAVPGDDELDRLVEPPAAPSPCRNRRAASLERGRGGGGPLSRTRTRIARSTVSSHTRFASGPCRRCRSRISAHVRRSAVVRTPSDRSLTARGLDDPPERTLERGDRVRTALPIEHVEREEVTLVNDDDMAAVWVRLELVARRSRDPRRREESRVLAHAAGSPVVEIRRQFLVVDERLHLERRCEKPCGALDLWLVVCRSGRTRGSR